MKPTHEKNDAELFAEAVKDVKPLGPQNLVEPSKAGPRSSGQTPVRDSAEPGDTDRMSFVRGGLQKAIIRKLRSGQIPIAGALDLHGHTLSQAEPALRTFLQQSQEAGRQVAVRIIHGKGLGSPETKSVLKGSVREWLVQNPMVLACCEAGQANGGSGAVHVLLRKR